MSLATAQDDRGTVPVEQLVDQNAHTLITTDPTAWFSALEVGPQGFSRPVIVLIGNSSIRATSPSDTDMAFPPRSRERARWLMVSFSQKRDLLRDNGRDNKRMSMPSQVRSKLDSNPGTSAVLSCTWSPTAVSVRRTAKHFRVITSTPTVQMQTESAYPLASPWVRKRL